MNNILNELLPRTVRLWLYVVVGVLAAAFAAWQVAEGNVVEAIAALIATFSSWLAAGNVTPPQPPLPEPDVLVAQNEPDVAEQPPHAEAARERWQAGAQNPVVYEKDARGTGENFYPDVFDRREQN